MYIFKYIYTKVATNNKPICTSSTISNSPSVTPGDVLFARLHCGRGGLFGLFYRRGDRQVHVIYVHNEA